MKLPRLTTRRLIFVVAAIVFSQAGSLAFQRFLQRQARADDLAFAERVCRQRASVCEELSPRLREVATLAREVAQSASSDFERTKWLEMAHSEEAKATRVDHEAVQMMIRADQQASRAIELYRSAWRPWEVEPE